MQLVSFTLGRPSAGWLPIEISIDDFTLSFEASDLGLNAVDQLIDAVFKLRNDQNSECYFYLEPAAYILKITPVSNIVFLRIEYLEDFDDKEDQNPKTLYQWEVNSLEFQQSLRNSLQEFLNNDYRTSDWPRPEKVLF